MTGTIAYRAKGGLWQPYPNLDSEGKLLDLRGLRRVLDEAVTNGPVDLSLLSVPDLQALDLSSLSLGSLLVAGCGSLGLRATRLRVANAAFIDCDLTATHFQASHMWDSLFLGCCLDRADFSNSDLKGLVLVGGHWAAGLRDSCGTVGCGSATACDFSSARLTGATMASSAITHELFVDECLRSGHDGLGRWREELAAKLDPIIAALEGPEDGGHIARCRRVAVDARRRLRAQTSSDPRGAEVSPVSAGDADPKDDESGPPSGDVIARALVRLRGTQGSSPEVFERVWEDGSTGAPLMMQSSSFQGAELERATMVLCSIHSSDVSRSSLRETAFVACRLELADFEDAHFRLLQPLAAADEAVERVPEPRQAIFALCDAGGADFSSASLNHLRISGSLFGGCVFRDATLHGAVIDGLLDDPHHVSGAGRRVIERSTFARADFTGARLPGAAFSETTLDYAIFRGCDLTKVRMDHTVTASSVDFTSSIMDEIRIVGCQDAKKALFSGARLVDAVLSESDLASADFSAANLAGARFSSAVLRAATFRHAHFSHPDDPDHDQTVLDGAILVLANFDGCDLRGLSFAWSAMDAARFVGSRLEGGSFRGASARDCDFTGAWITGTDFADADLTKSRFVSVLARERNSSVDATDPSVGAPPRRAAGWPTRFDGAVLADTSFSWADLTGASLVETDLSRADLTGVQATRADFSAARVDLARFESATLGIDTDGLAAACMVGVSGTSASFRSASLQWVDLSRAVLIVPSFDRASLDNATLCGAQVRGGYFEGTSLNGAKLEEADLSSCNFVGAALERADFTGASLKQSDLQRCRTDENTKFDRVDLRQASITNCNFSQLNADKFWSTCHLCDARIDATEMPSGGCAGGIGGAEQQVLGLEDLPNLLRWFDNLLRLQRIIQESGEQPRWYWRWLLGRTDPNRASTTEGRASRDCSFICDANFSARGFGREGAGCPRAKDAAKPADKVAALKRAVANREGASRVWLALRQNAASLGLWEDESRAFLSEKYATLQAKRAGRAAGILPRGQRAQWRYWQPLAGAAYRWGESLTFPFIWAALVIGACAVVYGTSTSIAQASTPWLTSVRYSVTVFCGAPDATVVLESGLSRLFYMFESLAGVLLPALFIIGLARRTAAR